MGLGGSKAKKKNVWKFVRSLLLKATIVELFSSLSKLDLCTMFSFDLAILGQEVHFKVEVVIYRSLIWAIEHLNSYMNFSLKEITKVLDIYIYICSEFFYCFTREAARYSLFSYYFYTCSIIRLKNIEEKDCLVFWNYC